MESSLQWLQDGVGVGGYGDKNLGSFEGGRRVHSGEVWSRGEARREEERLKEGEEDAARWGGVSKSRGKCSIYRFKDGEERG